jgi:hypothetical protein
MKQNKKLKFWNTLVCLNGLDLKWTFSSEFRLVCSKIKDMYSINELKDERTLQGENILYISLKIFQMFGGCYRYYNDIITKNISKYSSSTK